MPTRGWHSPIAAVAFAGICSTCIIQVISCKGDGTHVLTGRLYVEGRDCLGTTSSLDAVEGDESTTCAPACLVQRHQGDASRSVYVTTVCAPYPFDFDARGNDPACAAALRAFARNDTCLSDGGSTHAPSADASATPIDGSADDAAAK